MSRVMHCECGDAVRAEDDEALVKAAEEHLRAQHPEIAASVSREQILAMSEEE
jgi:predicted small metal-binding protein